MTDPRDPRQPPPPHVPLVIQDASRAVEEDLRPTISLVGEMLFGDFWSKHGFVAPRNAPPPVAAQAPLPTVRPQESWMHPAPTHVVDAEIVGEECQTCGGDRVVGAKGFEVPCPICSGCKTCRGRGKVGRAGHEVTCPACSP